MENTSASNRGGGAKPAIRFGFSWADEVEREEREQQQQQEEAEEQRRRETEKEQQTKPDPFGAARPREVVLAEKGVDWRARDRELDLHPHPRTAPRPRRSHKHAGPVAAHGGATPARGAPRDAAGAGRTPHPRGRRAAAAASTTTPLPLPPPTPTTTVSRSAWGGGSKRKCAGEGPAGPSRRVRQVDEQRRKVFGELNAGEGCASSIRASDNKGRDSGGSQAAQGIKSSVPAVADGENRVLPATKVTATEADGSDVAQKRRRGGKRRNGKRSNKTPNQQTLVR